MSINAKYMSQEESDEAEDDVLIKSRSFGIQKVQEKEKTHNGT